MKKALPFFSPILYIRIITQSTGGFLMKKKMCFVSSLMALSCASCLQADASDAQIRSLDSRITALEQKKSANSMVNPSGRPQVRDGANLFFMGDFLVWQAHENGLEYAVKVSADKPVTTVLKNSSTQNMHFDWNCGFRVGLGWNTPHDGWDLLAKWTWFQNNASRNTNVDSDSLLLPTNVYQPGDADVEGFGSSQARWHLHLNMIDLEMGREFFVSKWMTLRPFISLRSAWIYQKGSTLFTGSRPVVSQRGTLLKGDNDFWGIGPRVGLNTDWGLGWGFSLFGNASASLLYGFFDVTSYQRQLFSGSSDKELVNNTDSVRVGRAISEIALGLRYDTMFADDHCHLGVQAGWENLMFFGQNQFRHFSGVTSDNAGASYGNQGDLTIQGWTLAVRLDF
jgi:hypothetical protein